MQIMYIVLLSVGILSQKKKEENHLCIETLKARGAYVQKIKKLFFYIH